MVTFRHPHHAQRVTQRNQPLPEPKQEEPGCFGCRRRPQKPLTSLGGCSTLACMGGFLLGVVVGIVINLITLLFSREKALKLIPWFLLYIAMHGTAVLLDTDSVRGAAMAIAKKDGQWWSYLLVMLIAAGLAGVYWTLVNAGVTKLARATEPPPVASAVPEAVATLEQKSSAGATQERTTPANPVKTNHTHAASSPPSLVPPASPVSAPPLRRPMDAQTKMLRSWIRQTMDRTSAREMWLSQIFQSLLDGIPGGPDIDVPQALRHLASEGEVEILETTARTYRTWWGELFNEDIRFRVKTLSQ